MNFGVLIPLILVLLGFTWGFWLIFRKGDMVSQPMKMLGYFVGALLALVVAGFLTVIIFPAWANQLLGMATSSTSVQSLQDKTQQLLDASLGQPASTARPTVPTSPVTTPVGGTGALAVTPGPGQRYTVQTGDTVYSIARRFGVSPQSIQQANNLADPNVIKPGQVLIIP